MIALVGLALASSMLMSPQSSIVQSTTGWCSSNFINVKGPITISCTGVDPQAMASLNTELKKKDMALEAKISEANEWAARYRDLRAQLTGKDDPLSRQALIALRSGRLADAETLLKQRLVQQEKDVDSTAANHFALGLTYELRFRPSDALAEFEQSYRYRPQIAKYGLAYGNALLQQKNFTAAEEVLEKVLMLEKGPQGVSTYVLVPTLQTLALLYEDQHRFREAESNYLQALRMARELAASKSIPDMILLAEVLSNLAVLYQREERMTEAVALHLEALSIVRPIAMKDGPSHEFYMTVIQDNLGIEYGELHRISEAQTYFRDALKVRRSLAERDHFHYDVDLARTLTNMGVADSSNRDYIAARPALEESLAIRRTLAKRDPQVYTASVALTLNDLGIVYTNLRETEQAKKSLTEALHIYEELFGKDNNVYRLNVSDVLVNLSYLDDTLGNVKQAIDELERAVALREQLAQVSPVPYANMVRDNLRRLGDLYMKDHNPEKARAAYGRAGMSH